MALFLSWIVLPVLLGLIAFGCGLLVERAAGLDLPGALLPPIGLALVIAACDLTTIWSATAQLALPLVVALAFLGYAFSYPIRRRVDGWMLASAFAVFAAYAAPIVLSGSATFAGYQTLDDTATWLALADHTLEHGRAVTGLDPSTYSVVLHDYIDGGTPLGALMALGLGGKLAGQSLAWVFQPTIAVYATMLGLALYSISGGFVSARPLRALVAFLGAQPALLFAYAFWSGIKELASAFLIALVAALVAATFSRWPSPRAMLPAALATAALIAVLSPAGAVWLFAPAIAVFAIFLRRGLKPFGRLAVTLTALVAVFSIPSIAIAHTFLSGSSHNELTASNEVANLGHPLDTLQLFGIWPATDFRTNPHDSTTTYVMIGVLIASASVGVLLALRRRHWAIPLYVLTAVTGVCVVIALKQVGLSSPWLIAKAMAEGSPALVAAAVVGIAVTFELGRRVEATVAFAAVAIGVLWSNGLAYSNVWLAPRSQLGELQAIAHRFDGQGPTLMTEYQPYGARYFLRAMAPEAASERRARPIFLRSGGTLSTGDSADLDQFALDSVMVYRSIVLRRSPVESRPPSVYDLVWRGRWYEVWQRPTQARRVIEHLSLGDAFDPAAVPACSDVLRLAGEAQQAGGLLAAVVRPSPPVVVDLTQGVHSSKWQVDSDLFGTLIPHGGGTVSLNVGLPHSGRYRLWLGGSFRRTTTAVVDGHSVGSVGDQLNNDGQWTPLGSATLAAGAHRVSLRYGGSRLSPGSGGLPFAMGPLVLSTTTAELTPVFVDPAAARSLCGKRLDWVEALGP